MSKILKISILVIFISLVFVILSLYNRRPIETVVPVVIAPEKNMDLIFYGDSRSNPEMHQKIVNQIIKLKPAAIFHVGDLVDNPDSKEEWASVINIIQPLKNIAPFFVAAGNHEKASPEYYNNFELPGNEKWYSWDKDNVHVIVLDTNNPLVIKSEQYDWLENDLINVSPDKFVIVVTHHPLLSVGYHSEEIVGFEKDLLALLEKYNVKIIFSGHDHNYERFFYKGINHIICGGGGTALHAQKIESIYLNKFIYSHNFCLVSVKSNELIISAFDENGQPLDNLIIGD
jgi:predicted phosphodiesterase